MDGQGNTRFEQRVGAGRGRLAAWLAAPLVLAACGGGVVIGADIGCELAISELTGQHGSPDEVEQRVVGGLRVDTFFFHRSGFFVTFTSGADLGCERRDFLVAR